MSPLATALGDAGIAYGSNLGTALQNPGLLNADLDRTFEISYQKYITDIRYTQCGYAQSIAKNIMLAGDFAYMDYGRFTGTDEWGELTGNFNASEYRFGLHGAYAVNENWSVGASMNFLYGQYEVYKAFAIAAGLGVSYADKEAGFKSAFAIKNLGSVIHSDANAGDQLPLEIEWSCVKKLAKAPFAFSVTLNDIQNWKLYHSPTTEEDPITGETQTESKMSRYGKEMMSHLAFGIELRPSDVFCLMGGYNFKRQNQLSVDAQGEMVGFSAGVGIRIKQLQLQYAWAPMHLAGSIHHVGLSFRFK